MREIRVEHVACMREIRHAYKISVLKSEGKRSLTDLGIHERKIMQ
jgi:hypothetical protein